MKRTVACLLALLIILFLSYLYYVAREIEKESSVDEAQRADVIIILGAAEYHGRPSPVLESRLKHALDLYSKGLATYLLTTGGAGGDPRFTEGEVERNYLVENGVPSEAILVEPAGATTAQSLDAAAEMMHSMNLHSCVVVSDGYHIYRVKRLLQAHGIKVYGSPRPSAALTPMQLRRLYLRQAAGFILWQIGVNI